MAENQKPDQKDPSAEFKDMVSAMITGMKDDILKSVKTTVHDIVEQQWNELNEQILEDDCSENIIGSDNADANALIQDFTSQSNDQAEAATSEASSCLDSLASEFCTNQSTGQPITDKLAAIVNNLLNNGLSKEQLAMKDKYLKPENCEFLVTPKVNKLVWSQLKQEIKNADSSLQKGQELHMSSLYALLKVCNELAADDTGDKKKHLTTLTHALVLALSANRQFNLGRRELLRPHLNKQYQPLCNPSVPITSSLFGDDLNKEIEDLTKANAIGLKIQGNTGNQRFRPYGFNRGRGRRGSNSFRGRGRGSRNSTGLSRQPFLPAGRGQTRSQT